MIAPIAVIGALVVFQIGLVFSLCYAVYKLQKTHNKLQRAILLKLVAFALTSVVLEIAFPGYLTMQAVGYFVSVKYGDHHAQSQQENIGIAGQDWEVTLTQNIGLPVSCAAGLLLSLLRITDLYHIHIEKKTTAQNLEVSNEGSLNSVEDEERVRFAYGALSVEVRTAVLCTQFLHTVLLSVHLIYSFRSQTALNPSKRLTKRKAVWRLKTSDLQYMSQPDAAFIAQNHGFSTNITEQFPAQFDLLLGQAGISYSDLAT